MSLEAITAVRKLPRNGTHLEPRDRFVLYALADHADDEHEAWPSTRTLAEWTGYAESTVRTALAELEAWGLIRGERRTRANGSETSKRYHLAFVDPPAAGTPLPAPGTPPSERRHPTPRQPAPPPPAAGTLEPSLNPQEKPSTTPTPARANAGHREEDEVAEAQLSQAALEAHTAAERRRARSHATALLAQQHRQAHAALQDLQGVYSWPPGRYVAIAERVLDLARDHGTERTAKALDAVITSGAEIKQPIAYVVKILTSTRDEAAAADRRGADLPAPDLDEIFGLGAR